MRQLEETNYGYRITLVPGDPSAVSRLLQEVETRVRRQEEFGVLVDMRSISVLPIETQEGLKGCIDLLKAAGMRRQAIVLNGAIATLQAQRLSKEMAILDLCRYLDVSSEPRWEQVSLDWLIRGIDPSYR